VRPLLAFGRAELREDLKTRKLEWVDDPSNEAERFERVRMRALVQRLDAASSAQALRVMDGMARMRAAVAAEARRGLAVVEFDAGGSVANVPLKALQALGGEARLRLVEALLMAAGGKELAPRSEALKRLAGWVERGAGPAGGLTLGGAWIRLENDRVTFAEAPVRRGEAAGNGPAWDRAADLLGDPMLAALVP
jgi:tRNA(Ile)-lysidine synthase